jgi:hypothetical protein
MIDIKLDDVTHDLQVIQYDLVLVSGVDQIRQAIKMRLLTIFSEWFLDTREGLRYFDLICTKNPNLALVDSIMKTVIVDTIGVNELMSYSSILDKALRKFSVTFQVNTIYGITTDNIGVI